MTSITMAPAIPAPLFTYAAYSCLLICFCYPWIVYHFREIPLRKCAAQPHPPPCFIYSTAKRIFGPDDRFDKGREKPPTTVLPRNPLATACIPVGLAPEPAILVPKALVRAGACKSKPELVRKLGEPTLARVAKARRFCPSRPASAIIPRLGRPRRSALLTEIRA
jgi:hypothetical protein